MKYNLFKCGFGAEDDQCQSGERQYGKHLFDRKLIGLFDDPSRLYKIFKKIH